MTVLTCPVGGFRFLEGVFQYSAGVATLPGYEIVRVRFSRPLPMEEGFARIDRILGEAGRPLTAFCACELRSPEPFSEDGFRSFNEIYVDELTRWGLFEGGRNPVARSNVCPVVGAPDEPSFHAFCYTVPSEGRGGDSFVIAGSGETREGQTNYSDHIVRPGDTSPDGLRTKARFVLTEMERRMAALGFGWPQATAAQVYTAHDIHPFFGEDIVRRGAAPGGLIWNYDRPPIVGLEFEMDVRSVAVERNVRI